MWRAAAAVLVLSGLLTAAVQKPAAKKPSTSTAKKKSSGKKSGRRMPSAPATRGRQTVPDPARSREIQEALQREGYLKSAPSGKWDAATSDAFSRYQAAHGVRATGKPDAHSLFSLGLGPKYPSTGSN